MIHLELAGGKDGGQTEMGCPERPGCLPSENHVQGLRCRCDQGKRGMAWLPGQICHQTMSDPQSA